MGADPLVAHAKYVLGWLLRTRKTAFTVREAFKGTKGRIKTVDKLLPVLDVLSAHGYIRQRAGEHRPGPGRQPSLTFKVNPHLAAHRSHDAQGAAPSEQDQSANYANANGVEPDAIVAENTPDDSKERES